MTSLTVAEGTIFMGRRSFNAKPTKLRLLTGTSGVLGAAAWRCPYYCAKNHKLSTIRLIAVEESERRIGKPYSLDPLPGDLEEWADYQAAG